MLNQLEMPVIEEYTPMLVNLESLDCWYGIFASEIGVSRNRGSFFTPGPVAASWDHWRLNRKIHSNDDSFQVR